MFGYELLIGTYTEPVLFGTGEIIQGKGEGIYRCVLDCQSGELLVCRVTKDVQNPSFLRGDHSGRFVYAVNELKEYMGCDSGSVSAFERNDDRLTFLNSRPTFGKDPCFLTISPDNKCVIASNFMGGSVCLMEIQGDGTLSDKYKFIQHVGSGVDEKRQSSPHAHAAVFDPSGKWVVVPDLGTDELVVYHYNSQEVELERHTAYKAKSGSGPRYCEFSPLNPEYCYMVCELSNEIVALKFDARNGAFEHMQTVTTLYGDNLPENTCADLHISPDGKYLYASNRGVDTIEVFELNDIGCMQHIQSISSGGKTPRNFALMPDGKMAVVANQDSDNLVVFAISKESGILKKMNEVKIPSPVCVCCAGII